MRFAVVALASVLAFPAVAQQISPMTGTTAGQPSVTAPPPAGAATPAPARPARPRSTFKQRFDAANTTHDGNLTLDQAKAGRLVAVVRNFDAIDAGKKGYVTMADVQAWNKARAAARRQARQRAPAQ